MALRKVRADVAGACAAVQAQLLQELHSRVYGPAALGPGAGPGSHPASPRARPGVAAAGGGGGGGSSLAAEPGKGLLALGSPRGRSRLGQPGAELGSPVGGGRTGSATGGSSMPQFVLDALAGRDQAGQARLSSLRELVGCLVQVRARGSGQGWARGEARRRAAGHSGAAAWTRAAWHAPAPRHPAGFAASSLCV
jgi:hypothetical protein